LEVALGKHGFGGVGRFVEEAYLTVLDLGYHGLSHHKVGSS